MIQAKWGDMRWEITDKEFKLISSISTFQSVKRQTNNDNEGSSAISNQGLELQEVPLIYNVMRGLGVDPYEEFKKWQSRLTHVNALYVGTQRFGSLHMQLDSVGFNPSGIDNAGNILAAEISLNFVESAEEASEAKSNRTTATAPILPITTGLQIGPSTADKAAKKTMELYLNPDGTWSKRPKMPGFTPNVDAPIFHGPFKYEPPQN